MSSLPNLGSTTQLEADANTCSYAQSHDNPNIVNANKCLCVDKYLDCLTVTSRLFFTHCTELFAREMLCVLSSFILNRPHWFGGLKGPRL